MHKFLQKIDPQNFPFQKIEPNFKTRNKEINSNMVPFKPSMQAMHGNETIDI